jgi:subtilisin family serine protease
MKLCRFFLSVFLYIGTTLFSQAQFSKYIIRFTDKNNSPYSFSNPGAYLSDKAIQRRINQNISIDSTDLPVNPSYIKAVLNTGVVSLINQSKWLNAIIIQTTDANALTAINNLPFVKKTNPVAVRLAATQPVNKERDFITRFKNKRITGVQSDFYNYGASAAQINLTKGAFLHNIGLRGEDKTLALLDGGYFGYLTNSAFDSARINNQFLGSWDFVANEASVNEDNAHGMYCLSVIAANWPGNLVGTAPHAKFWLFRTEDSQSEQPIEEYNWACGAEYADSVGTDIISSSLGYNDFDNPLFNHSYTDLNGQTIPCSIAARLAAQKGMLVVISAGNMGNDPWKYITAPADADNILTVGATDANGTIASFSSYGPTADGRIKPDAVTVGQNVVVAGTDNHPSMASGTSFSCPNLAGLAACLWQAFPNFNNTMIITAIRKSADRYNTPDNHYGYGIPDMKKALGLLLAEFASSSATVSNCTAQLNWTSKDLSTMRYEVERKLPNENTYSKIAAIPAKGTTFSTQSYTYTDRINISAAGTISYRIRQIIDTAVASFSAAYIDSTSIDLNSACLGSSVVTPGNEENKIIIYPNPIDKVINLVVNTSASIPLLTINIYDVNGRLIYQSRKSKPSGLFVITIPAEAFPRGEYFISLYDEKNKIGTAKFVKS